MKLGTLPGLGDAPTKVAGGYRLIPVGLVAAVWFAFLRGLLRVVDVRAFFACHEVAARRSPVSAGIPSKFTLGEILRLTGGSEKRLKGSLERLQAVGFLSFSENEIRFAKKRKELAIDLDEFQRFLDRFPNNGRLLPVPRRILRLIAGGARSSLIATILGHLIWGLYRRKDGTFNASGRVKASWIAETFGVGLRRVKQARGELVELGWLVLDNARQWEHNRWGVKFHINLVWNRTAAVASAPATTPAEPVLPLPAPVDLVELVPPSVPLVATATETVSPELAPPPSGAVSKLAPPPADFGPGLAPPESDKKLPTGSKNQKPASRPSASGGPAGFLSPQERPEKTPGPLNAIGPRVAPPGSPTLKNIVPEDLKDTPRLMELHRQAVDSGLIGSSESDRLKFVAAAEHARVIGTENPPGLFSRLVRSKLWHYLTQDDEDAANGRLKAFLFGPSRKPGQGAPEPSSRGIEPPRLSDDARLVREVRAAAARAGWRGDAFPLLRREKQDWTRERWDSAIRELEGPKERKDLGQVGTGLSSVLAGFGL